MRIGLINELHGRPGSDRDTNWEQVRERALAAEAVGFDMFVFEDALMYRTEDVTYGVWESMTIAGALAEATDRIGIGQSVVNTVYRSPAMTASIAETLNEISDGRYVLGLGAGNTPDSDYEGFGFPLDYRYSRFAEACEIIHTLLRTGSVDFAGRFHTAKKAEIVLRGPGSTGPRINIAGSGEKMLDLTARIGDAWNWWIWDEGFDQAKDNLETLLKALDENLSSHGRSAASLERTLDYYTVVPEGFEATVPKMESPLSGSSEAIAAELLRFGELGFDEVRCHLFPRTLAAIESMEPVIELVHAS
jgi:alkanesulfonate monooxygenase SsuD/methylene tetrahydromethanopterin reductase-like flavin-dependent oxidoreductase (luciferase family)